MAWRLGGFKDMAQLGANRSTGNHLAKLERGGEYFATSLIDAVHIHRTVG
jgi:hypothetical protein